jgi:hypothetical protein
MVNLFSGGDEYNDISGMTPDPNAHHFILDVDPISGKAMRQGRRLQVSVGLRWLTC